ncbi:hypothetical protein DEJ50_15825 [Streptomyces venezuelae]|uniref:Secreted protein n=1 Tax=Streptomyces venezuelae TaxID=54571 RepID=A0A5P2D1X9_STRVZ|nr:hypothetical protein [Streptomyces venezuelae]QES49056.1 hypothetical protein DEJ50_15825 [Streptomyces venezuelae]
MRRGALGALTLLTACVAATAALTGCGGPARDGFVAVGAAGAGPERAPGETVPPKGGVEFQPLAAPPAAPPGSSSSSSDSSGSGSSQTSSTSPAAADPAAPPGSGAPGTPPGHNGGSGSPGTTPPGTAGPMPPGTPTAPGTTPGRPTSPQTPPGSRPTTPPAPGKPGTTPPATPAQLTLGTPVRAATGDRWCEKVTVGFTNTGTTAARSGTVTFTTHILGNVLGLSWGTITSTQPLPAPIAGGSTQTRTFTVCLEAWRVPLGWHIETRQVSATWR